MKSHIFRVKTNELNNKQKGLEVLLKESEGRIQVPLMMSIDHQGHLSFSFFFSFRSFEIHFSSSFSPLSF